ncbi:MAG TPA: hypothetical protein VE913_19080 [Longimicrobium sp.]|nr:hypothetical protein [Longimicrobium sp.]
MIRIQELQTMLAVVLAVSLATERLVAITKTVFPRLDDERPWRNEQLRRITVQVIALISAWVSAALFVDGEVTLLQALVDTIGDAKTGIPVPLVALLATGGSAFWSQVVQYSSSVKTIAAVRRDVVVARHGRAAATPLNNDLGGLRAAARA